MSAVPHGHTAPWLLPGAGSALSSTTETLDLITRGITEFAGFRLAAISLVRGEDVEVVAVAGEEEARAALLGVTFPLRLLRDVLDRADQWGTELHFLPHERLTPDLGGWGEIAGLPMQPEDWHPEDRLLAPLHDSDGVLLGIISVDLPETGRRPDEHQRDVLARYTRQAVPTVLLALEREALVERVRLADATRRVIRRISERLDLRELFEIARPAIVDGFGARGAGLVIYADDDAAWVGGTDPRATPPPTAVVDAIAAVAQRAWIEQEVVVATREDAGDGLGLAFAYLPYDDVAAIMLIPLGTGLTCLGHLLLSRTAAQGAWTELERTAASDIGHDLGQAILNARSFQRERQARTELEALSEYRGRLIATVSHELKNPLTAIRGNLDLLSIRDWDADTARAHDAVGRAANRMSAVIDDLLLLEEVDRDEHLDPVPVDLANLVREARDLTDTSTDNGLLTVVLRFPDGPVVARGDRDQIGCVVTNLVSNAVKYSDPRGRVTVTLEHDGAYAVLTVADTGIGISPEDRARLFTEFFRSADRAVRQRPGTGLGLAIVHRIVTRHGGTVEVDSELGAGTTFRVRLPLGS